MRDDGRCGQLGRHQCAVEALPGERVEKTGGVADQQPAGPARRVTRWPSGEAPATASVGSLSRHVAGSLVVGGIARTIASATARAPSRASVVRHERPRTIPTLTRPPATGAMPT